MGFLFFFLLNVTLLLFFVKHCRDAFLGEVLYCVVFGFFLKNIIEFIESGIHKGL